MIKHCYEVEKAQKIVIGSGGASFVDGGLGAMNALGILDIHLKDGTKHKQGEIALPSLMPKIKEI
jgi:glycerate kinase